MTRTKVFKAKIKVTPKTVIMDQDSCNEDGDPQKVLFNKGQITEIVMNHFVEAMKEVLEALEDDSDLRDTIFNELMIDVADYDLDDIAEVEITF